MTQLTFAQYLTSHEITVFRGVCNDLARVQEEDGGRYDYEEEEHYHHQKEMAIEDIERSWS